MPSLLDTNFIKKAIAQGFKGKLSRGTIRRVSGSSLDFRGNVVPGAPVDYAFEGTREDISLYYANQAGIPVGDVFVLVILGSTTVEPQNDDLVNIKGGWYKVRRVVSIDPASASAKLQCYPVESPI